MTKKILLSQNKEAIVDDEDYEYLNQYKWYVTNRNYAANPKNGLMHRVIVFVGKMIDLKKNEEIDHINGNRLDNRRCNLRVVTRRQNSQNRHVPQKSKYPGVCWHKWAKQWITKIKINGKQKHIGYFRTEIEAFEAYKKAVHELTGEKVVCEL
jgi:hypothetical protein